MKTPQQILDQAQEEFKKIAPMGVYFHTPESTEDERLDNEILSWHTATLKSFIEAEKNEIATIKRYVATIRDEKTGEIKDEYVVRDRDLQDKLLVTLKR